MQDPLSLVTKAVEAAEKLKVPAVISPEDIISPHLDDLSMMTYVSMFRERVRVNLYFIIFHESEFVCT